METTTNKAIPELSVDTQVLAKLLRSAGPDELVTYAAMSIAIKRDVRVVARHLMESARRIVQREDGKVFECVFGEGLKLMTDSAKAGLGSHAAGRMRNISKRTLSKMATTSFEALSNEDKVAHNTGISLLSALAQATRPKSIQRLSVAVGEAQDKLPLASTLEMFKK